MALRIILLILLFLIGVSISPKLHAEDSVKKLLFDDCDQARREFLSLPIDVKLKTFDFLSRVLALNTQAPTSPEAFALLPGPQSGAGPSGMRQGRDVIPGQLWQSADAKRELRAKRCALELFLSAGASALSALPRLITIYSEQPLSDEIAVALEETAASIAEVAHKSGMLPPESDIDAVLPHTIGSRPLLAQNLLGEYPIVAIPRLVLFLASLSESDAPKGQALLRQLDPDATRSLRAFLDVKGAIAADRIEVVARRIGLPTRDALQAFLPDLLGTTLSTNEKRALLPLLAKTCVQLGGLTLEPTQAEALAKELSLAAEQRLSFEEKKCLLKSSPRLAAQTGLEVLSADEPVISESLALLPFSVDTLAGENRTIALSRIRALAADLDSTIAPLAISQLALFPEKRADTTNQLFSILSTAAQTTQPSTELVLVQRAAFKTLATLGLGKESARFTQLLLASIRSGNAFEDARPLIKSNSSVEPEVARLLINSSADVVGRALLALTDRSSLSSKTVAALLEAAKTGTHPDLVIAALSKSGPTAASQIRKSIVKTSSIRKIQGVSALIKLHVATKTETQELATLMSVAECSLITQAADILMPLTDPLLLGGQPLESLRRKVTECLPALSPAVASALIRARPEIIASSCASISTIVGKSTFNPAVTTTLVDFALTHSECSAILEQTILHESTEVKIDTLHKLSQQPTIPESVLIAVLDGPLAASNEPDLFFPAAILIAKHAQERYTWKHMIREAISAAGREQPVQHFLDVSQYLDPALVLDEVLPALDSDDPERIAGACYIGASLGAQAIPIISKLWHLREKRNPSIRYAAAIALLEINPLTPELQDVLRQLLVNRYLVWAMQRPIKWQQTVALVELPKAEFGTLRTSNLERLLVTPPTRNQHGMERP